jgi:carboxymethylenebutenolidase
MCFELDSVPPIPVIRGAAVSHEDLVLEARDGNQLAAFLATPDEPSDVGVVILPDVRGLYRFYEELALRFAERGYTAIAIDYFGRTAGIGKRGEDFEYRPHSQQATAEGVREDVALQLTTSGREGRARSSQSASASGAGIPGSRQPTDTGSPALSASTAGPA